VSGLVTRKVGCVIRGRECFFGKGTPRHFLQGGESTGPVRVCQGGGGGGNIKEERGSHINGEGREGGRIDCLLDNWRGAEVRLSCQEGRAGRKGPKQRDQSTSSRKEDGGEVGRSCESNGVTPIAREEYQPPKLQS